MDQERRKNQRYSVNIPVTLTNDSKTLEGRIVNASLGGILVEIETPGDLIRFEGWAVCFDYGDPPRTIRCPGAIARIDEAIPSRFAVKLELALKANELVDLVDYFEASSI